MHIRNPTLEGRLVRRYKRFLADVELPNGETLTAHCPNTGSLRGCLEEGARVILRDSQDAKRKLRYTFQTIEIGGTWVNVDTGLPNTAVAEAIELGRVKKLAGYSSLRREVKYGKNSRIDILLEDDAGKRCYVEVKNTTLAEGKLAMFPDAVTERGRKHLLELRDMVKEGHRGVIFFCVSRDDVTKFTTADDIDPKYGETLREVLADGVEAMAWTTSVEPDSFELKKALKLQL